MLRSFRLIFILVGSLIALLGLGSASSAHAQVASSASGSMIPAVQLLNSDGTLNLQKGASGALDLAGWNVSLDPQHGPVLSRPAQQPAKPKLKKPANGGMVQTLTPTLT